MSSAEKIDRVQACVVETKKSKRLDLIGNGFTSQYTHWINLANGNDDIEVFDGASHVGQLSFRFTKISGIDVVRMDFFGGTTLIVHPTKIEALDQLESTPWEQVVPASLGHRFTHTPKGPVLYSVAGEITEPGTKFHSNLLSLGPVEISLGISKNR